MSDREHLTKKIEAVNACHARTKQVRASMIQALTPWLGSQVFRWADGYWMTRVAKTLPDFSSYGFEEFKFWVRKPLDKVLRSGQFTIYATGQQNYDTGYGSASVTVDVCLGRCQDLVLERVESQEADWLRSDYTYEEVADAQKIIADYRSTISDLESMIHPFLK